MIFPFGCFMREVQKWSIKVQYEFYGQGFEGALEHRGGFDPLKEKEGQLQGDLENSINRRYFLYKDEKQLVSELKPNELRDLKVFMANYQEPPQLRALKA